MPSVQIAIDLICREATLLDAKEYDEWLTLWDESGLYIIPVTRGDDFADNLNIAYDDHAMRTMRVARLTGRQSVSAIHAANTVRLVGGFVDGGFVDGVRTLHVVQHLAESRQDAQRLMAARISYKIIDGLSDGTARILQKVVRLANADGALHALGYLL